MSYAQPTRKECLRCGFRWLTRWRYLSQGEKATEPKRCARCRTPLWNVPKKVHSGPKSQLEIQRDSLGSKSAELKRILQAAGFTKGDGVAGEGIALVSRVAKARGLRDWPDTRNAQDYDRLTDAVLEELNFGRSFQRKGKTSHASRTEKSRPAGREKSRRR